MAKSAIRRWGRNAKNYGLDKKSTQHYSCVMIPEFIEIDGPWKVLPEGIHAADLEEIKKRFVTTEKRKQLFEGLERGVEALREAGCTAIFLDGSFVTEKPDPGDYDVCWDPVGVDEKKLNPVFLDFSQKRKRQKETFLGEYFPSSSKADQTHVFLDFFQLDKYSGGAKGIIRIHYPEGGGRSL